MTIDSLSARLAALRDQSLLRWRRVIESSCGPRIIIDGRPITAFASNDYLGLAADPRLVAAAQEGAARYGVGGGASHLVSGHYTAHEALESRLASFVGSQRALYFSSGYMANLGIVTALAGRQGAVFSDELNHASLIDAIALSRAKKYIYPHRDAAALAEMLAASTDPVKLVVTDAVFSMDGDMAPLPEIFDLCEEHDAWLVVDDAHGFGVLGPRGRGALAHFGLASPRVIYMGTLGKAAGVSGAFVAADAEVIEWLVQRARTYIYTTASPPMLAHALLTAVALVETEQERRDHLAELIALLRDRLRFKRWRLTESRTPIQPVIIGANDETLRVAGALMEQGLWVPAIRPPTVPPHTARLRISLSAAHTVADVRELADALSALE